MAGEAAPERRWSADGLLLIAPDMDAHLRPILERAVAEYGPARWDGGWTVGGVVFAGEDPSVRAMPGHPIAIVVLPRFAADDMNAALAFLAHELVHCLHLSEDEDMPPMIEEGAAVRFSIVEATRRNIAFALALWHHQTTAPNTEHYAEALGAVEALLALNPEAIRTLRAQDADWNTITPERIMAVVPTCPPALAAVLCEVREMRPDSEAEVVRAFMAERESVT